MSSQIVSLAVLALSEEGHHEVNHALSWGIGALALAILLLMLGALVAFGGGREHS